MNLIGKSLLTSVLFVSSMTSVIAASPWLPPPKEFDLSLGYSQETYQDFWFASKIGTLANTNIKDIYYVGGIYGITDRFAADFLTGIGRSHAAGASRGDLGGRLDTRIGLIFRAIDEFTASNPYVPTVSFRLGGNLRGTYSYATSGNVAAFGNKDNGAQFSIIMGKYLPHDFAVFGEAGYRYRDQPVPNAYFGYLGILQSYLNGLTWSAYYEVYHSISGLDVGKPPFNGNTIGKFGFQATKEDDTYLNGSLSYTLPAGPTVTGVYTRSLRGRNTPKQHIASLFVVFPIHV